MEWLLLLPGWCVVGALNGWFLAKAMHVADRSEMARHKCARELDLRLAAADHDHAAARRVAPRSAGSVPPQIP